MKIKQLEKSVKEAIKNLRQRKLKSGLPFMINSDLLPSNQCYLEYPDGKIALVFLCRRNGDFKTITNYSSEESDLIRKKFKLVLSIFFTVDLAINNSCSNYFYAARNSEWLCKNRNT
jgi:hypothetical protein